MPEHWAYEENQMLKPVLRLDQGFFTPWIWDLYPAWGKKPDPGSGMNIPDYISKSLEATFGSKILKFFYADPGYGILRPWIRDRNSDPGSGVKIPDAQHWLEQVKQGVLYVPVCGWGGGVRVGRVSGEDHCSCSRSCSAPPLPPLLCTGKHLVKKGRIKSQVVTVHSLTQIEKWRRKNQYKEKIGISNASVTNTLTSDL
jgi:hypothetical protein